MTRTNHSQTNRKEIIMKQAQSQGVLFWVMILCAALNVLWYTSTNHGFNPPAVLSDIVSLLLGVVCVVCAVTLIIRWRESKKHAAEAASLREKG